MRKYNTNPVFNPGNRIYLDTSWIKYPSGGGNNYWVLLVDEVTKMCWSLFIRKKSELPSSVIEIFNSIINSKRKIMFIRDDNAGEKISLE